MKDMRGKTQQKGAMFSYVRMEQRIPADLIDESPAGYSSAGCAPAEPASASPADIHHRREPARCTAQFTFVQQFGRRIHWG
jgi:hypothetical protein